MPHLNQTDRSVSVKMIAYQPRNVEKFRMPTVIGTTSLYDFNNGHLVAISDAVILTAIRTGAASAIASQILAHPESSIIGLVGAGAQAVTQLHALSRVFPIREVLVYDIDLKVAHSFPERSKFLDLPVRVCSLKELEQHSDIICTTTSVENGADPVISGQYLQEHVHINAVGADQPGKTELPLSLLKKSFVCPDFIEQAMKDGECQQLERKEIAPDLIELLKRPKDYYDWREKRTIFDSTGLALEDQVEKLVHQNGIVAPKGKAGSVLFMHPNCVHGSNSNMSPFDRTLLAIRYNSVKNLPLPVKNPRPDFQASRDYTPIEPLSGEVLLV